ncbi:MAG: HD domain-containing protein [Deltaproteobacteria bacterium]|jgi:3'-5' exoribonuclease|nr:HD domain-containing protein [Deltaproteobacteria bacterium]
MLKLPIKKNVFVTDLVEGKNFNIPLLVTSITEGVTRHNSTYLTLKLQDMTGEISAKVWDPEQISKIIAVGKVSLFNGRAESYNDQAQLVIKGAYAVGDDEVDMSLYVQKSDRSGEDMLEELRGILATVADPDFRAITLAALAHPRTAGFAGATAAKLFHHAYAGGLAEHTLSVVKLADMVSGHYGKLLNRSLLLAGAALHDIGKVWDYTEGPDIDMTTPGRLLGHLVSGPIFLAEVARELPGFPEAKLLLLQHLLVSHHGEPEKGSAVRPKILEGLALHFLDDLDGKMAGIGKIVEKEAKHRSDDPLFQWTPWVRHLEDFFMRTPRFGEDDGDAGAPPASGHAGPPSSSGHVGSSGPPSSSGHAGAAGSRSSLGHAGTAGPPPSGQAGAAGSPSSSGRAGAAGSHSSSGRAGTAGPPSSGHSGAAGPPSSSGHAGAAGPSPSKGDFGMAVSVTVPAGGPPPERRDTSSGGAPARSVSRPEPSDDPWGLGELDEEFDEEFDDFYDSGAQDGPREEVLPEPVTSYRLGEAAVPAASPDGAPVAAYDDEVPFGPLEAEEDVPPDAFDGFGAPEPPDVPVGAPPDSIDGYDPLDAGNVDGMPLAAPSSGYAPGPSGLPDDEAPDGDPFLPEFECGADSGSRSAPPPEPVPVSGTGPEASQGAWGEPASGPEASQGACGEPADGVSPDAGVASGSAYGSGPVSGEDAAEEPAPDGRDAYPSGLAQDAGAAAAEAAGPDSASVPASPPDGDAGTAGGDAVTAGGTAQGSGPSPSGGDVAPSGEDGAPGSESPAPGGAGFKSKGLF